MAFLSCTKLGTCVRGYAVTSYHPKRCGGCPYASEIDGGNNTLRRTDGMPLTQDEKAVVMKLSK